MEKRKLLGKTSIFADLKDSELDAVGELCVERTYRANEVVFTEGSKGEDIYIVQAGRVRIELALKGKQTPATVHRVTEGRAFGELAIVDTRARSASAICEGDCVLVTISQKKLNELFEENNHVGYVVFKRLSALLAARLRRTNLQLVASILWE